MNSTMSTTTPSSALGQRVPEPAWLRIAKVLTLLAGSLLILAGLAVGSLYLVLSLFAPHAIGGKPLNTGTTGFAIFALTLSLGGALVFQVVSSLSGRSSSPFRLPLPVTFIAAFVVVVALGVFVSAAGSLGWMLFPVLYVLGIALPVGWVLSLVGNRLVRSGVAITWRETVLQLSSGAFVTTTFALFLEMLAVIGVIVVIVASVLMAPGGADALRSLAASAESPGWLEDPTNIEELLFTPVVAASLFFLLAVAVPLVEELLKTVGVLLMAYRRPSRQQALWWGVLGGAGFAFAEGLFNGNLAVGELSWGLLAPMRFGTTILHCSTGALMGLGWYALLNHRRLLQWLKYYVSAVILHAVWNALSLGLMFASPDAAQSLGSSTLGTAGPLLLMALLLCMTVAIMLLLLRLVRASSVSDSSEAH